jgi:hypothetical protein
MISKLPFKLVVKDIDFVSKVMLFATLSISVLAMAMVIAIRLQLLVRCQV